MSVIEAVVLGILQGFTEFLPVSSSGHLVMGQALMDIPTPGVFFEVVLHVATLLSVLIVYRGRLAELVAGATRTEADAWRYIGLLAVASVPAGIVGVVFMEQFEALFNSPAVVGIAFLVTGLILWSTRFVPEREQVKDEPGWALALVIGIAQAFAITPGISRSGTTITTGLWGRLDGEAAAEFSFLMSVPAVAGAAVLQIPAFGESIGRIGATPLAAGFVTSLIAGVLAIKSLVWLLRRQSFHVFAYYLWTIGGLFLLYLWL